MRLSRITEEKLNNSVSDIGKPSGIPGDLDNLNLSQINGAIDNSLINDRTKDLFKG